MDFRESLEFLYGLQRFGIKLGLDNTRTLLERAGMPQQHFLCVHIAGTNGKGSTSAFLAAILQEAGLRVGLYTSPHLQSFCERIRIDGISISEPEIAALTDEVRRLSMGVPATFFEFTTVMALSAFAKKGVEIAILETGMGGRLDATNAVTANLSILTPISLDHLDHLGKSLREIAREKGGIIKAGVPVISAQQPPEVLEIFQEQAALCQSPLYCAGDDFSVTLHGTEDFDFYDRAGTHLTALHSGLVGAHQPGNAALAIAAAISLRKCGLNISDTAIRHGLINVIWPGRLEWWGENHQILLDGAHNGAGAQVLADYLATLKVTAIHWLVGVKDDKNYHEILTAILPMTACLYAVEPPAVSATSPDELVKLALQKNVPARPFSTVTEGLLSAQAACGENEIILVAGSLFLVGAVRDLLMEQGEVF